MRRFHYRWRRSRPPTIRTLARSLTLLTLLVVTTSVATYAADLLATNPRLDDGRGAVEAATAADGYGGVFTALVDERRSAVLVAVSHDDGRSYVTTPVVEHPVGDVSVHDVRVCATGRWWMALDTDVYVAWREQSAAGAGAQVYVAVSHDRGASWSAPVLVSPGRVRPLFDPALACHRDGTAHVAWADAIDGREDIYVASTRDRGETWSAPRRVDTGSAPGSSLSRRPDVAIDPFDDDHALVVWEETPPGATEAEIRGNVTRNGGASWLAEDVRVDPEEYPLLESDRLPQAAIGPGGTAYAAWIEGDGAVEINASDDGGAQWGFAWQASRLPGPIAALDVGLALRDEPPGPVPIEWLRLLWQGATTIPGEDAIYYNAATRRPDGTWRLLHDTELRVDRGLAPGDESREPRLCSGDPDHVFAAYDVRRTGRLSCNALVGSLDGGASWFDHEMYPGEAPAGTVTSAPGLGCDQAGRAYLGWSVEPPLEPSRAEGDACVGEDPLHGEDPAIDADRSAMAYAGGGRVYTAWRAKVAELADHRIHVARSDDDGAWWPDPPVVITADIPGQKDEDEPALATAGREIVYAAWAAVADEGGIGIMFSRSLDGATTWSDPVRLDSPSTPQGGWNWNIGLCALDDGHVYAVWQDHRLEEDRIYFNRSADFGATWSGEQELSGFLFDDHRDPRIACTPSGGVYIVFQRWRDWPVWMQTWLIYSDDFAQSLDSVMLSADDVAAQSPSVAADDLGNVLVAWVEDTIPPSTPEFHDVVVRVSHDSGQTWGGAIRLDVTDPPGASVAREPHVVTDGVGHYLVAWLDGRPESSAWVNGSLDGGRTWFAADEPIDTGGFGADSDLVAAMTADGRAFAAWYDTLPHDQPGGRLLVNTSRLFGTPGSWGTPVPLDVNRGPWAERATSAAMTRDGAAVAWRGEDPAAAGALPFVNRQRILPGFVGEVVGLRWVDEGTLTWRPVDLAEHYEVLVADAPQGPWTTADSTVHTWWEDHFTPPPPGAARFHLVRAVNIVGEGPLGH
ncbi:MAG: hypothetical protein D6738_14225 [Acidobacteria bacterium]|nr:MAG: hypothetical protein D6738_14225 [Acidobacteriota bacterium]